LEEYERLFGSAPKLAPPPKRRGKKEGTPTGTSVGAPMEAASEGISGK
jgi:molybdenum cofactor cytidylyltransferase